MRWFSPKVSVRTKKVGVRQVVSSVEVAAEHLLQWEKRGPKWRKAVEMCLAAIEGKVEPDDVGKAFKAAAEESGMLEED
ncbi:MULTISPECIES: DUF982 domain-containing protein [unclassified Mesorhizobium]|uniref:DUF982 domain-containing protein n=1 Tax=unclassified Mesorhizobium TaxID=325217 RepID=UPI000FD98A51|nr:MULTISPECIES: DUF982 domain-containing protein [unclassified Mesorhizobium]TGT64047.1 DUF982 domain-containing protein [Mesorhizobium sp. M2E.F.Ca.ET.166.01.1.1]TGV97069.1 DUF982 domain-containing protein [Mesorhizobium sp. M2E.F.Ca.ET.154.01.1.1]